MRARRQAKEQESQRVRESGGRRARELENHKFGNKRAREPDGRRAREVESPGNKAARQKA